MLTSAETDTTAGSSNTDQQQNQGQLTHNQNSFDDFEEEYEDESDEQMTGSDNTLGGPPASSPITRYKPILCMYKRLKLNKFIQIIKRIIQSFAYMKNYCLHFAFW